MIFLKTNLLKNKNFLLFVIPNFSYSGSFVFFVLRLDQPRLTSHCKNFSGFLFFHTEGKIYIKVKREKKKIYLQQKTNTGRGRKKKKKRLNKINKMCLAFHCSCCCTLQRWQVEFWTSVREGEKERENK